jgi:hypothetical protein
MSRDKAKGKPWRHEGHQRRELPQGAGREDGRGMARRRSGHGDQNCSGSYRALGNEGGRKKSGRAPSNRLAVVSKFPLLALPVWLDTAVTGLRYCWHCRCATVVLVKQDDIT